MSLYSYRAIDIHGKSLKGLQDAANLIDLEQRLKRGGLDLIDAKMDRGNISLRSKKVKRPELITLNVSRTCATR
jgi:type IV pilus assembly protein PilC